MGKKAGGGIHMADGGYPYPKLPPNAPPFMQQGFKNFGDMMQAQQMGNMNSASFYANRFGPMPGKTSMPVPKPVPMPAPVPKPVPMPAPVPKPVPMPPVAPPPKLPIAQQGLGSVGGYNPFNLDFIKMGFKNPNDMMLARQMGNMSSTNFYAGPKSMGKKAGGTIKMAPGGILTGPMLQAKLTGTNAKPNVKAPAYVAPQPLPKPAPKPIPKPAPLPPPKPAPLPKILAKPPVVSKSMPNMPKPIVNTYTGTVNTGSVNMPKTPAPVVNRPEPYPEAPKPYTMSGSGTYSPSGNTLAGRKRGGKIGK